MSAEAARRRFRELHRAGTWLLPNPWDVGSAKLFAHAGHVALASTSYGFAATMGRGDHAVSLGQLVDHLRALCSAVDVPVNVDSERCFDDVAETVGLLAEAGAAGLSIEDYDPASGSFDPIPVAVERVRQAVAAAESHGIVVTARADHHFHPGADFDDTLARLTAFRDVGAGCLYAPGLVELEQIAAVVELGAPVNVLHIPGGPTMAELSRVGVTRVSTGSSLTWVAYAAALRAADELRDQGTSTAFNPTLTPEQRRALA